MPPDSDLSDLLRLEGQLRALPEAAYCDRKGQPCRHPGGLYSQSLGKVLSRMRELTDTVPLGAHPDTLGQTWPKVMSALEALLVAIDSHADDLKTILAATKVPSKAAAQVGRQIDATLEELAGRPINRVKHHGERLEACYCHTASVVVYGYFVAGVRADGAVAPSERAHGASGTHWSLAAALRRLLGQLILSARAVLHHVRTKVAAPISTWTEQERSDLRSIAAWLQKCPSFCFPNEFNLQIPDVGLRDDEPYVRLQTLKRLRSVHTLPSVRWCRSFTADGVSRTFAVV